MRAKQMNFKANVYAEMADSLHWQNICYFCSMESLIVQPETKAQLTAIKAFLKELGVPFKKGTKVPNEETRMAMEELKAGNGKKFKDVDTLFKSI